MGIKSLCLVHCSIADPETHLLYPPFKFWLSIAFLAFVFSWYQSSIAAVLFTPSPHPSNSLPYLSEVFLGREREIRMVQNLLNFDQSPTQVVSIVGAPGVGKSALAISVGHKMAEKGVAVHYVNMYEVSSNQALVERILISANHTHDTHCTKLTEITLQQWTRTLVTNTLLILDNSDDILHRQQSDFQSLVKSLLRSSKRVKVLITAKQTTAFLGNFQEVRLQSFTDRQAVSLLQSIAKNLTLIESKTIANLVGHMPLALQVVGTLMNRPLSAQERSSIVQQLKAEPILVLSPPELAASEQVQTSINVSYRYLQPEQQRCTRLLANFPGSFDLKAADVILDGLALYNHSTTNAASCTRVLMWRFLLEYNQRTKRYQFPRLIKEFLCYTQKHLPTGEADTQEFTRQFVSYYLGMLNDLLVEARHNITTFHIIDLERHNFEHAFESVDDVIKTENTSFNLNLIPFSSFLDHVRSLLNSSTNTLVLHILQRHYYHYSEDVFEELKLPLEDTAEENIENFQNVMLQFDLYYNQIVGEIGIKKCFKLYVSLLITWSKLVKRFQGAENAKRILLARKRRIDELHSTSGGRQMDAYYVKFYSTLAHNYLLLKQHKQFMHSWQKILWLRKTLAPCEHCRCSTVHFGLAFYGMGDYERSILFLEQARLSKQGSPTTRARLLMVLHSARTKLGQLALAQEIVEGVPGIDLLTEFNALLNNGISELNYREFIMLYSFYTSIGYRMEATLSNAAIQLFVKTRYYERKLPKFPEQFRTPAMGTGN